MENNNTQTNEAYLKSVKEWDDANETSIYSTVALGGKAAVQLANFLRSKGYKVRLKAMGNYSKIEIERHKIN